jgi:formimidoylglutamate deiminase
VTSYIADLAWIDGRVRARVGLEIDADGRIAAVTEGAGTGQRIAGLVVPGVANLHSHAIQRACPEATPRFLAALTPDDVQAIAAQLYVECLLHGYTAVAEFHTLHNAPDGRSYDDPAEMALRIVAAARQAGIGLRLLPVLCRRGGFGGAPPTEAQRRSLMSVEAYGRLCQDLCEYAPIGVAPLSLGTVAPDELQAALVIADLLGPSTPVHIQLAEQAGEVAECLSWSGRGPARWLLDNAPVDARWCLLHATHTDAGECPALAASGAVMGLCQTTEARLGDGIGPLIPWLKAGGRFGIGSGSNVSTSPVEELRRLEYIRRPERDTGPTRLLGAAIAGGAQALGRRSGAIAPGRLADLVVLDPEHPALVGRRGEALLDAWVFAGNATPVAHVMVAGQWVVQHGAHVRGAEIAGAFARAMRGLADVL